MENIFDEIFKNLVEENEEIEPIILDEKTINVGDRIFQILKIDSISMMKVSNSTDSTEINKNVMKYCTKGLDWEEFMLSNSAGVVTKVIHQIMEFNDII